MAFLLPGTCFRGPVYSNSKACPCDRPGFPSAVFFPGVWGLPLRTAGCWHGHAHELTVFIVIDHGRRVCMGGCLAGTLSAVRGRRCGPAGEASQQQPSPRRSVRRFFYVNHGEGRGGGRLYVTVLVGFFCFLLNHGKGGQPYVSVRGGQVVFYFLVNHGESAIRTRGCSSFFLGDPWGSTILCVAVG